MVRAMNTHFELMIRTAVICLAASLAMIGCDDEEEGTIAQQAPGATQDTEGMFPETEEPSQAEPEPEPEPAISEEPLPETELELVDGGKKPRSELRYAFEQGRKHEMVMDMQMSMTMTMNGAPAPEASMPKIRTRVALQEEKILENGNVRAKAVIRDMVIVDEKSAEPAMLASIKPELARIKNLEGWSEMTNRGFIVGGEYKTPPGASPQLQQMVQQLQGNMKQLSFPLPEEPVGEGAKWRVKQVVRNSGMTIDQVSNCTLKSLKGTSASLRCVISQDARVQTLRAGLPPGTQGKLLSHKATGTSDIDLDLNTLVPNTTGDIKAATEIAMTAGGRSMTMKTQMTMNMSVRRK